ncbi:Subtilisin-like protease SBT5.3 [Carex littledalei]|uniref:Subtilisin-like protease SBT5.3 n=1 Tax=Carex littledalei TaxID=544730 RepID=A0A833RHP0_9POAL|nr:Subtilisin-like protease SBT5.3 [Carex littledalei]
MPDVISVIPNRKFTAHTARSWDFLRLDDNSQSSTLLQKGNYGEDVIIGASNCSNKIIGARWYDSDLSASDLKGEYRSPRDYAGHGTHTASTAAGKGFFLNFKMHHCQRRASTVWPLDLSGEERLVPGLLYTRRAGAKMSGAAVERLVPDLLFMDYGYLKLNIDE